MYDNAFVNGKDVRLISLTILLPSGIGSESDCSLGPILRA